ncbi:hypothetical protein JCM19238_2548 [Vibrio ponticus]|nr:hypothetical protein JCM19238_2548 [Vibrio ponticus]
MINHYRELQYYLDTTYQASWQNVTWLKDLDKADVKLEENLRDATNTRLRLLSASIEYLNQQHEFTTSQLLPAQNQRKRRFNSTS